MNNHLSMTAEERAIKQAHLQQASVHIVDAIANVLAAGWTDDTGFIDPPVHDMLRQSLFYCTEGIRDLQQGDGN